MRHYETIYIIAPNITDETYQEVLQKFRNQVEKQKGIMIKTQEWGKSRLAYNIKKFETGSYVLMDYCADPGMTADIEREFKHDDRILKYQTVKLEDQADPEALLSKEKKAEEEMALKEKVEAEKETEEQHEDLSSHEEVRNGV